MSWFILSTYFIGSLSLLYFYVNALKSVFRITYPLAAFTCIMGRGPFKILLVHYEQFGEI